jgi:hypothetical protein
MKVYHREVNVDDDLKRLVLAQSAVYVIGVIKVANLVRSIEDKRAMQVTELSTRERTELSQQLRDGFTMPT